RLAIRRKSDEADRCAGPRQRRTERARRHVPQSNQSILARRRQRLAIGRKNDTRDRMSMSLQLGDLLAGVCVPQEQFGGLWLLPVPVAAGRGEQLAIGRESQGVDLLRVAGKDLLREASASVPEPYRVVGVTGGNEVSLWCEGDGAGPDRRNTEAGGGAAE